MGQEGPPPDYWQSLDEPDLVRFYTGDDEDAAGAALVELRRRYLHSLQHQAIRQAFGDDDLAQEALAETDLKLWRKRKRFDPEYPPRRRGPILRSPWRAWAGTLLRNNICDGSRRRRVEWGTALPPQGPADPPPHPVHHRPHRVAEPEGGLASLFDSKGLFPEEGVWKAERKAAVRDCLRRLKRAKKNFFDVLVMYYWGGKVQEEIAAKVNVVVSTVCKRLEAARTWMAHCLAGNHPEVTDES